uniref:Uncharacterized protein n=1 Tax=Rhizophagus irregularis (strain DAOM 181602 / DAOM 197198 / MUCL 43194) TaxID=747089 RepID=U9SS35_RHIID
MSTKEAKILDKCEFQNNFETKFKKIYLNNIFVHLFHKILAPPLLPEPRRGMASNIGILEF